MSSGHQAEFYAVRFTTPELEEALQTLRNVSGSRSVVDQDAEVILEQALRYRRAEDRLDSLLDRGY